jgi:hypothetical protein
MGLHVHYPRASDQENGGNHVMTPMWEHDHHYYNLPGCSSECRLLSGLLLISSVLSTVGNLRLVVRVITHDEFSTKGTAPLPTLPHMGKVRLLCVLWTGRSTNVRFHTFPHLGESMGYGRNRSTRAKDKPVTTSH